VSARHLYPRPRMIPSHPVAFRFPIVNFHTPKRSLQSANDVNRGEGEHGGDLLQVIQDSRMSERLSRVRG
jgi:hypothetical protein